MHRFSSRHVINRFRLASLLLFLKYGGIVVSAFILVKATLHGDREGIMIGAAIAGATLLALLLQLLVAERTRCPLCLTPVLGNKGCSKHRNAKTVLGSYRLRVALAIFFKDSFRCPYCDEPSVLEVRSGRR
jgi:hypothetical protein